MDVFTDKVAIVTGGASGIGHMLCEELGRRGASVVVADVNIRGAEEVAAAITKAGGRARAALLDVSRAESIQGHVDAVLSEHGRLDYMFNNAGIAVAGELRDLSLEHWQRIIDINLWGVINGTSVAYPVMVRQGFGHIVNTASLAGLLGYPASAAYAATKSAVIGLSTSLRAEAAGLGVKVSVVCPGYVRTGIYDAATVVNASSQDLFARIPFKLMDAREAARSILGGVARNQNIIVFPFYARLLWWLYRLHPGLITPLGNRAIREFRSVREESSVNPRSA